MTPNAPPARDASPAGGSADAAHQVAAWLGSPADSVGPVQSASADGIFSVVAAGATYHLRRYREADSRGVDREHRLIRHVARAGVPAPAPVPAVDGSTQAIANDAIWALFEAVPGEQLPFEALTPAHTSSAGRALAVLHRAAHDMPHAGFATRELAWDGAETVERLRRVRDAIAANPCDPDTDAWARKRLDSQIEWLCDLACPHRHSPAFAPQVIHGDFQHANLLFSGTAVSAVIGWAGACVMPRGFEVARACFVLCQMDRELSYAFLNAYADEAKLERGELEDGARAWGCFADHHSGPAERLYLHGDREAARLIWRRPFAPFLDEWRALGF
jgi:homoserine kinase type II